jgi:Rab-GTPase-TBC domain
MDKYLVQFSQDIDALPPDIREGLDEIDFPEPPPRTETETTPTLLQHTDAVSARLEAIRARPTSGAPKPPPPVPSITLESDPASPNSTAGAQDAQPTMLLASDGKPKSSIWEGTLLRLLHIHCVLHASYGLPEGPSSALVAILGVLLCVFSSDIDDATSPNSATDHGPTDRTAGLDAESSAFWAMESLIAGLREALEEETDAAAREGWNHMFSRMLQAVDAPLWEDLQRKSLDPALPYYSHRWIPTLFTHTLHVHKVLPIWDAVFTLPPFAHDHETEATACPPQVEFLLDVGVTMLTRARVSLFRLGKSASPGSGPRSLWAEEQFALPPSNAPTPGAYSPVGSPWPVLSPSSTAWGFLGGRTEGESGEAFLKGVKILQSYNVEEFGGMERVLQGAWGLYAKRIGRGAAEMPVVRVNGERETQADGKAKQDQQPPQQLSRFDRLAEAVWRGITNESDDESTSPSPSPSPIGPPSPSVVVPKFTITAPPSNKPTGLGFGARLRDSVWKGVTNQIDPAGPSPDPSPEPSPVASRSHSPLLVAEDEMPMDEVPKAEPDQKQKSGGGGGWFGGLRDLDAAATLAKTSTNLRVRAMDVLGRTSPKPESKPRLEPITEAPAPSSTGSWAASFAAFPSRVSFGLGTVPEGENPHPAGSEARSRHGSLPIQTTEWEGSSSTRKHDSYSPPPRPAFFRPARDSIFPTGSPHFSPSSSISETSPSRGSPIQSALAALTSSSVLAPAPKKSGPKPLLLNSRSLITRTPSRAVSPIPPNSGDGHRRTSTASSSSRTNSVDQLAPGASGVVSLHRGPVTSPRMVGGPNAGLHSRDSMSSAGSNRYSDHRFSYEESSAGERDLRHYSFGRAKNPGFIMDRGFDSPITVGNRDSTSTGTSGARTSPPHSLHIEEGVHERAVSLNDSEDTGVVEQESSDETKVPAEVLLRVASDESASEAERVAASPQAKLRAKRHRDISASDLSSEARRDLGDDTFVSPPSAGFSSSLEPGIAYDENDATPLATTPTTPNSAVNVERKGATLNRSKTPRAVRRPRKGAGEESVSSPTPRMPRRNGSSTPSRASTALVSGSEEEGAKADIEDEDELYTDLLNAY